MTRDVSINDFGLVIAYLLPGFAVVWGIALAAGTMDLRQLLEDGPTLGGFLSGTVVSLAAGLAISTLRWLVIDSLHHATGVPRPDRNFADLGTNIAAYSFLNDAHYRYYQHAAGMLVATVVVYGVWRFENLSQRPGPVDLGFLGVGLLYYLGSRDTLRNFYKRTAELLPQVKSQRRRQHSIKPVAPLNQA